MLFPYNYKSPRSGFKNMLPNEKMLGNSIGAKTFAKTSYIPRIVLCNILFFKQKFQLLKKIRSQNAI